LVTTRRGISWSALKTPIAFGALHQRLYRDSHENALGARTVHDRDLTCTVRDPSALGARTVHDRCSHLANVVVSSFSTKFQSLNLSPAFSKQYSEIISQMSQQCQI
ncbi:hypothetical protein PV325_012503, partial [Microctonus aethiopoides]